MVQKPLKSGLRRGSGALPRARSGPRVGSRGLAPIKARTEDISAEDRLVDAFSLFVRWSRRELHGQANKEAGVEIEQSAAVILGALHFHGPVRMSDLAEHLSLDRSTVSRQVADVVDKGWVSRLEDAADARATRLTLTPDGRALRRKLANAFGKVCMDLVADWKPEDRLTFVRLMDKLADRFRGEGVY